VTDIRHAIAKMYTLVTRAAEVSLRSMKRVAAINEPFPLSNIGGKTNAMQDDFGHQRTSLARRKMEVDINTSSLLGARFGAIAVSNVAGIRLNLEA